MSINTFHYHTYVSGFLSILFQWHTHVIPAFGSHVWENCSGIVYVSCETSLLQHFVPFWAVLLCTLWQGVVLVHGAKIGFFQGDIRSLSDDLCTLKPTVFPVVPRLLNRMYDRVGQPPSLFLSHESHFQNKFKRTLILRQYTQSSIKTSISTYLPCYLDKQKWALMSLTLFMLYTVFSGL